MNKRTIRHDLRGFQCFADNISMKRCGDATVRNRTRQPPAPRVGEARYKGDVPQGRSPQSQIINRYHHQSVTVGCSGKPQTHVRPATTYMSFQPGGRRGCPSAFHRWCFSTQASTVSHDQVYTGSPFKKDVFSQSFVRK